MTKPTSRTGAQRTPSLGSALQKLSDAERQTLALALADLIAEQEAEAQWLTTMRTLEDREVEDDDLV